MSSLPLFLFLSLSPLLCPLSYIGKTFSLLPSFSLSFFYPLGFISLASLLSSLHVLRSYVLPLSPLSPSLTSLPLSLHLYHFFLFPSPFTHFFSYSLSLSLRSLNLSSFSVFSLYPPLSFLPYYPSLSLQLYPILLSALSSNSLYKVSLSLPPVSNFPPLPL